MLPVSPNANTCTQALLPALSPLVAPKPSSTSFSPSNPEIMHEVTLFYFITDRFTHYESKYSAQKKLHDLSDCRSTNWGAGLEMQTQDFVNLLWCWHFSSPGSNLDAWCKDCQRLYGKRGFRKLSRLNFSERLRFMSGRIQVASCPVTLRLSLTDVCKIDCVFQMCCCGTFFEWRRSSLACSQCVGLNL